MGRLPTVVAVLSRVACDRRASRGVVVLATAVLVSGCEGDPKKAAMSSVPRERTEVVAASSAAGAAVAEAVATATGSAPVLRTPESRKLCEGQLKVGPGWPKKGPSRKAAAGAASAPGAVPGRWTWVNLWAAWCAPCKEELPRIRNFGARMAHAGKEPSLMFISLDDDERQLDQFLASQPDDGLRSTFWLREGHERDDWLVNVGIAGEPSLPAQLLFDPRGKLRCTVQGAVEDRDFAEISAIVSAQ
jgi:thiol-disulfide isomerase/thioredoxin